MANASVDLFAAIGAGDVERARAILGEDPALATSRDEEGVSALMRARYRLDRALVEAVKRFVADLDVFEAAALGDLDRLTELLDADPSLANARSGDGFTVLHLAAFFGQAEAATLLLERGADRGRPWLGLDDRDPSPQRGLGFPRGRRADPVACRRRSERPSVGGVDAASLGGRER
jgi:hypothetical protein